MADYRLESRLRDGTYIAALPWKNLQYELGWNKPYGIRFDLPLYHPSVTWSTVHPGLHEIWVWRNNVLVKAGPLWDAVPSSSDANINCTAQDLIDYFDVRLIDTVDYSAVDQTAIAWGLIDDSQNLTGGDLGIVQGTLGTGITRTASWTSFDQKYILEALQDFQEMNSGFDFQIDPATREFNAIYPRPQRDNNLRLEYPVTIRKYSVQYMGKYLRNHVRASATEPTYVDAYDTTSRSTYGLRDIGMTYRDAATVTDLTDFASKNRDQRKEVKNYPTVLIDPDIINVFDTSILMYGDMVDVVIDDGYVSIDTQLRYITAQITVDKQGAETVVIYLQDPRELN